MHDMDMDPKGLFIQVFNIDIFLFVCLFSGVWGVKSQPSGVGSLLIT